MCIQTSKYCMHRVTGMELAHPLLIYTVLLLAIPRSILVRRDGEDVTRMLRGNCSRAIL